MTAEQALINSGWYNFGYYWFHNDWLAIFEQEKPPYWAGTARDCCLANGIRFEEDSKITT